MLKMFKKRNNNHPIEEIGNNDENNEHQTLLIHNQERIVKKLKSRIEETEFATQNLIDLINEISKSVESQSQSITTVVGEIEEFSALTQEMYASTLDSKKIAEQTMAAANEGNLATDKSIDAMNDIETSVEYIREVVKSLSKETSQIDDMLNIIKDITNQTNLLALNAAIEAARAGEHGRGFAVVADEVGKLAKKSQESVDIISRTISSIKESIDKTSKTMDESISKVHRGVKIANDTVNVFSKIVETINSFNTITNEINVAIEHQTKNLDEIINSTQNINYLTENIMSSTEIALMNANYTKSSLKNLSDTSNDLNETTSKIVDMMDVKRKSDYVLRTFINTDIKSLDPSMVFDQGSIRILDCLHIGLLIIGSSSNLMPGIAKSWYVEEDNLTWVFNLRKGAKFHNGKEITAEDVKYSLERLLSPKLKSPNAWFLYQIEGAKEYNEGKSNNVSGISILDRYRVKIKLSSSYSGFLLNLAQPCCSIMEKDDLRVNKFTGCGPFILERKDEEKYVFKAFDDYLGGKAYVDIFEIYYKDDNYLDNYINGKYDFIIIDGFKEINKLENEKKFVIEKQDVMTTQYAGFNLKRNSVFAKDKLVRKAINYAIDKERIIKEVTNNLAKEAKGIFPPAIIDDKNLKGFKSNLNYAKKLLSESSYRNETLLILGTDSNKKGNREIITELIIEDLRKLGIRTEIVKVKTSDYMKPESISKADIYFMGWIADTGDPDNYLEPLFNPENYTNFCGYNNVEVLNLMNEAKKIINPTKRVELYKKIQNIILEDTPWILLYHPQTVFTYNKRAKNIKINTLNRMRYEDILIDNLN